MACLYFLFDVGCPHSYIASKRIESLCARARIEVEWCPVQLSRLRQGVLVMLGSARLKPHFDSQAQVWPPRLQPPKSGMVAFFLNLTHAFHAHVFLFVCFGFPCFGSMMHQDLIRQAARHGVQINFNPQHPSATHLAQEALSVAPKEVEKVRQQPHS